MTSILTRTLFRGPHRMQIRTNLFFARGLGRDGHTVDLPALENALASARDIRRGTGRSVWIEAVNAPAYVRPSRRK